jgi:hypothetical protein
MSLLSRGPSPRWRQIMTGKAGAGAGQRGRGITRPARSASEGRTGTPSLSSSDLAAPATASVIGRHRSTRGWDLRSDATTWPPLQQSSPPISAQAEPAYQSAGLSRQTFIQLKDALHPHRAVPCRRCSPHGPANRAAGLPYVSTTPSPRHTRKISATRHRQPARGQHRGTCRNRIDGTPSRDGGQRPKPHAGEEPCSRPLPLTAPHLPPEQRHQHRAEREVPSPRLLR